MALWDRNVFARKCVNRKMLDLLTKDCSNVGPMAWECKRRKKPYHLSWCEQSGCFAEAPKAVNKPIKDVFWCPTCQNSSQEFCDSTLVNTTCPKADLCIALRDENVFVRKCANRKMLELLTKDCRNVASEEWVCNRKRQYQVTFCDKSGCTAEFSKISEGESIVVEPGKNDFWCPTCQSSSQESCDSTLANTTCPKAELCMALRDKNVFVRKCVNRKMLQLVTKDCRTVGSEEWVCNRKRRYRVTFCDTSGCIAEFSKISEDDSVVVEPDKNDFWCPTCQSASQESCDAILANTTCPKAELCMALRDKNVFVRKCVNRKMLQLVTKDCRTVGSEEWVCNRKRRYHVTFCDTSGCIAEFSKISEDDSVVVEPDKNDFWCPTCQSASQESCDAILANTTCPKAELCMALRDKNVFVRKCVNRKMLQLVTKDCRKVESEEWICNRKRQYHVTFCDESGCKAEFSRVTKDHHTKAFWCPTCQSTSEESCAATFTNTTCPKADFCMALWDKNVFARKCINRKMLELLTKNCEHKGSLEWKCNRKRKYHVTVCNQSGCIAEVSGLPTENEIPQETPFQCHTCPICKNSQECENGLTVTDCPLATRCMVLRVNGTVEVESVFARICVNEKIFSIIHRGCANRQGCEISSCTQSRCKPTL